MKGYNCNDVTNQVRLRWNEDLRRRFLLACRTGRRRLLWASGKYRFARNRLTDSLLPCVHAGHATPLERGFAGTDPVAQANKAANLALAADTLNGLILRPGETMSFWKCLGKPTEDKGYRQAASPVEDAGEMSGGLCQLSNLLFWMTLHTPLTVDERYRHNYDLFPDEGRTQPFGSGATCIYPHRDLMITNDTAHTFQLCLSIANGELKGQGRCDYDPDSRDRVVERDHEIRLSSMGGYSRHNRLYRQGLNPDGEVLFEELAVENQAIMEYEPLSGGETA